MRKKTKGGSFLVSKAGKKECIRPATEVLTKKEIAATEAAKPSTTTGDK